MNRNYQIIGAGILLPVLLAATPHIVVAKDTFTSKQKAGYSLGVNMSNNLQSIKNHIDTDALINGLRDGIQGRKLQLSMDEIQKTLSEFQQKIAKEQMAQMQKLGKNNIEEGKKFLTENKNKKGIKTTKSGLQYKIIKSGKGKSPKLTDTVTTHYRGTLVDGTEFDSSYARNQPATFPVNGVIGGWTEALQLMKPGDKWKLYIPAKLAYGERGSGPGGKIGPNATLIFDIELIKIGS